MTEHCHNCNKTLFGSMNYCEECHKGVLKAYKQKVVGDIERRRKEQIKQLIFLATSLGKIGIKFSREIPYKKDILGADWSNDLDYGDELSVKCLAFIRRYDDLHELDGIRRLLNNLEKQTESGKGEN